MKIKITRELSKCSIFFFLICTFFTIPAIYAEEEYNDSNIEQIKKDIVPIITDTFENGYNTEKFKDFQVITNFGNIPILLPEDYSLSYGTYSNKYSILDVSISTEKYKDDPEEIIKKERKFSDKNLSAINLLNETKNISGQKIYLNSYLAHDKKSNKNNLIVCLYAFLGEPIYDKENGYYNILVLKRFTNIIVIEGYLNKPRFKNLSPMIAAAVLPFKMTDAISQLSLKLTEGNADVLKQKIDTALAQQGSSKLESFVRQTTIGEIYNYCPSGWSATDDKYNYFLEYLSPQKMMKTCLGYSYFENKGDIDEDSIVSKIFSTDFIIKSILSNITNKEVFYEIQKEVSEDEIFIKQEDVYFYHFITPQIIKNQKAYYKFYTAIDKYSRTQKLCVVSIIPFISKQDSENIAENGVFYVLKYTEIPYPFSEKTVKNLDNILISAITLPKLKPSVVTKSDFENLIAQGIGTQLTGTFKKTFKLYGNSEFSVKYPSDWKINSEGNISIELGPENISGCWIKKQYYTIPDYTFSSSDTQLNASSFFKNHYKDIADRITILNPEYYPEKEGNLEKLKVTFIEKATPTLRYYYDIEIVAIPIIGDDKRCEISLTEFRVNFDDMLKVLPSYAAIMSSIENKYYQAKVAKAAEKKPVSVNKMKTVEEIQKSIEDKEIKSEESEDDGIDWQSYISTGLSVAATVLQTINSVSASEAPSSGAYSSGGYSSGNYRDVMAAKQRGWDTVLQAGQEAQASRNRSMGAWGDVIRGEQTSVPITDSHGEVIGWGPKYY